MAVRYTVKSGDTAGAIAKRYGVPLSKISGYRSGNPNRIYVGEVLTIDVAAPSSGGKLNIIDIRGQLPRNGTWLRRPLSHIKKIAIHWDAEYRPKTYDSLARYKKQASYHINKDWETNVPGITRGDGLMYHYKIDNVGDIFQCRDLEDVTWQVGAQNGICLGVAFDCGPNQQPTKQQVEAFYRLMEDLCYKHPEFPAGRANIVGHQELSPTQCPGTFMPSVRSYRANRTVNANAYPNWNA